MGTKVTFNIEQDSELRQHIKDSIKGQIKNIMREEIESIIKTELDRKMKGLPTANFEFMLKESIRQVVKEKISADERNTKEYISDYAEPLICERIEKIIKEKKWDKEIDVLFKKRINDLLK